MNRTKIGLLASLWTSALRKFYTRATHSSGKNFMVPERSYEVVNVEFAGGVHSQTFVRLLNILRVDLPSVGENLPPPR